MRQISPATRVPGSGVRLGKWGQKIRMMLTAAFWIVLGAIYMALLVFGPGWFRK